MMNQNISCLLDKICGDFLKKRKCKFVAERHGKYLCRDIDALNCHLEKTCPYQSDRIELDFDIHGKMMKGYWLCEKVSESG